MKPISKTGIKGVTKRKYGYRAQCARKGCKFSKEGFKTAREAKQYYDKMLKLAEDGNLIESKKDEIEGQEFLNRKSDVNGGVITVYDCKACSNRVDVIPAYCSKCNGSVFEKIEIYKLFMDKRQPERSENG